MISINKLRKRNTNTSNTDDTYSQYIEDYQLYFDSALNKTKYVNYDNSSISGECIVLDVSVNNAQNGDEKYITTLPNSSLKIGDVVSLSFEKDIEEWIITEIEHLAIPSHEKFKCRPCNFMLKWMYKGQLYKYPSLVTNNTKYTAGVKSEVSGIIEQSAMFGVLIPDIEKTKMLGLDQRFIINTMAWRVTLPDRTNKGLVYLTLAKSSINTETDDVDNEIADYKMVKHDYKFDIPNNFNVTKDDSIKLVYSIQDNLKDIDYSLVSVEYSGNLIQVTKTDKDITITGKELGTGSIKLKVNLTNETKEFNITFNVVKAIVNEVKYNVATSNGYTYRPKEGSSLVTTKTINGTVDSTLVIDYSLDSNGTNLLSKSSISITKKSNTELQLRNVNISTPMSFTLTITDKSNGIVILTQVINLKGA